MDALSITSMLSWLNSGVFSQLEMKLAPRCAYTIMLQSTRGRGTLAPLFAPCGARLCVRAVKTYLTGKYTYFELGKYNNLSLCVAGMV